MKQCQHCRFKARGPSMDENRTGYFCRSELRCFNRLVAACNVAESKIKRIEHIGRQMSNACFNLSQQSGRTLTDQYCATMLDLRRQWDAAVRL